jgi:hypothetical protein
MTKIGSRGRVKTYRSKLAIEAMRWTDTDANREVFAAWFEKHGALFETRGSEVVLPDFDDVAVEGTWIVFALGQFIVMEDEAFADCYEEIHE